MNILIVDDEVGPRRILEKIFQPLDVTVRAVGSLSEARAVLEREAVDIAFVDVRLDPNDPGNRDGITLVGELQGRAVAILVTHVSEMETIRQAMRYGAYDYILKDSLDFRNRELFQHIVKTLGK